MSARLSICIATYNRSTFIGESLDSILCQNLDGVEIIIVDGASTDDTQGVISDYVRRFPDTISYHREALKGGVDQDYAKAVRYASGEYCWLMTDDDPLTSDAISRILQALSTPCSLLVVNAEVRDADLGKLLEERRMKAWQDSDINDLSQLFALTASYLTFIGGIVIRRQLWLDRCDGLHFGSELHHLWLIFHQPLPECARILSQPLIRIRYGNAQWTSRSFSIWMFKYPALIWSLELIPEAMRCTVVAKAPWRNWPRVFSFRAKGTYDHEVYVSLIAPLQPPLRLRFLLWAISRFPGRLANLIAHAIFCMIPGSSKLNWVELRKSRFCFYRFG